MGHGGAIDFHQQIIRQIGVEIGSVCRYHEICLLKMGIEAVQRRSFQLFPHRRIVGILLVLVGEHSEGMGISAAWPLPRRA